MRLTYQETISEIHRANKYALIAKIVVDIAVTMPDENDRRKVSAPDCAAL